MPMYAGEVVAADNASILPLLSVTVTLRPCRRTSCNAYAFLYR